MRRALFLLIVIAFLSCKKEEAAPDSVVMATAPVPTVATETMSTDTMAVGTMETATIAPAMMPPPSPPVPRTRPRSAPPPPRPATQSSIREVELRDYVKVPVYYATTRSRAVNDARNVFGAGRTTTHYGLSWVSIPRSHEAGELEEPSIFTLTVREDPAKHVVLLEVRARPKERWFSELKASIAEAGTKQTFVFVHGFNVAFADATRRTAQIKYDLGFDGPAILFSWPSHGKKALYLADEANAEWSAPQLAAFLAELRKQTGATTDIHIIAHSLGNRVLSRALERIDVDATITPKPKFSQIVLAAPDMDADVFRDQLAPSMRRVARGITLYARATIAHSWRPRRRTRRSEPEKAVKTCRSFPVSTRSM